MPSVSFDLVDASMMALLQDDAEAFMPSYDAAKGTAWNRRKASEALAAGIVAGDSVPALSKRLSAVTDAGRASAVRTARTYATAAQNAGRASTYAKAAASGVSLKVQWVATLDGRTRYSHRALDGEQIEEGGEFSNGLRYPGDPSGPAQEVYNCRCTTIAVVEGVDMSDAERSSRLGSSTYESWKAGKQAAASGANAGATVYGGVGASYEAKVDAALKAASGDCKTLYQRYEGQFKEAEVGTRAKDGSYYHPGKNQVHIYSGSMAGDPRGDTCAWFHEFGHNVDRLLGSRSWYSYEYQGGAFPQAVKAEVRDYCKAYAKSRGVTLTQAYGLVGAEINALPTAAKHALSDIFGGATANKAVDGYGHFQRGYWDKHGKSLATEAFAEMFQAHIDGAESLAALKSYLPKSVTMFEQMVKDVI